MRCRLVASFAAIASALACAGSAPRAQEVDAVYNPFAMVKVSIRQSPTDTRLGCKAVSRDKSTPAGPGNNPFQLGWFTNGWRFVDFPTLSTATSPRVTVSFRQDGEERSFTTTKSGRVKVEIDAKYIRLDEEGIFEKLQDIKGNLTVAVEGDPTEYKYDVGEMSLMMAALDSCVQTYGPGAACNIAGPQTPRDIADKAGTHPVTFGLAPEVTSLNLCNMHFHVTAEHKGPGFTAKAEGEGGYLCNNRDSLTAAERAEPEGEGCEIEPGQRKLKPGDTIEVHWVYTSCDVKPGKSLGACASTSCANPSLRVESQVFLLVNDASAAKLGDYDYPGKANSAGLHQAKALPAGAGAVLFRGSTTGKKYNDRGCSPYQATWNVRPQCAKLDIGSLSSWCKGNAFKEKGGHDVRQLVTDKARLDPIP